MLTRLESQLGRPLDDSQRFAVATLNDVTSEMLGELRRIGSECVRTYLAFHLRQGSETAFEDFTRDVIHGGAEPRTWGFRDVLALLPIPSKRELTTTVETVKAALAPIEGERWRRFSIGGATEANRRASDFALGAPGVLVRSAPYWWAADHPAVTTCYAATPMDALGDDDFAIALRRWIALRTSWWALHAGVDLGECQDSCRMRVSC